MTKQEVDTYFTSNWDDIEAVIARNAAKCKTVNRESIASEVYLVCVEKCETINNIAAFIRIVSSNTYKWGNSSFNSQNKSICNELSINDTYTEEGEQSIDEQVQRMEFAIEKFRMNAEPHQRIFCDLFVKEGVRTRSRVQQKIGISYHGARVLIKDFKNQIKKYEREI